MFDYKGAIMIDYPDEIFGAKKYEDRHGSSPYIIYCYDIFGGTFYVRVEGSYVIARFDYGAYHSSDTIGLGEFEGFEKTAAGLVELALKYFYENLKKEQHYEV